MLANSRLALSAETLIVEAQSSSRPSLLKFFLWIVSLFYAAGVKVRNALYDYGILRAKKGPLPVISIGSVLAGGAGKTPLIALIMEKLGGRVAVVSRGYRSSGSGVRVVSVDDSSCEVGDEPLLLKRRFPDSLVIVASDRMEGVKKAYELGAKGVILDDGMQHRRLHRDLELAISDATCQRPYYLPRGMIRDNPARLNQADYLFCRGDEIAGAITIDLKIEGFENHKGEAFTGRKVGLFCTIARPYRFIESVEKRGLSVEMKWLLPDHCPIDEKELATFVAECRARGLDGVVCTEKDWVKLSHEALKLPIYHAKARMHILGGHGHFDRLLAQLTEII